MVRTYKYMGSVRDVNNPNGLDITPKMASMVAEHRAYKKKISANRDVPRPFKKMVFSHLTSKGLFTCGCIFDLNPKWKKAGWLLKDGCRLSSGS